MLDCVKQHKSVKPIWFFETLNVLHRLLHTETVENKEKSEREAGFGPLSRTVCLSNTVQCPSVCLSPCYLLSCFSVTRQARLFWCDKMNGEQNKIG